jgi:hypothetical protein
MKPKVLIIGTLLLLGALALAACGGSQPAPEATACPTAEPCPTCPEAPACPEPVVKDIPFETLWAGSPHADASAAAFNHWNEADPQEIPVDCARCHSTPGYQDYLGADGSPAGVVDKAAPIGTVITCVACHNDAAVKLSSVTFPSGAEISGLGPEARCMVCHQGRASKVQVDAALEKNGLTNELDKVSTDLTFTNIHYLAAAATLYGNKTHGGYEYDGKAYDSKNDHVAGYDTCIGCHNQHSLEVKVDECKVCHTNVTSKDDLKNIRMNGSLVDYDGDGDITEGIYYEIQGLQEKLLQAIQAYGSEVAGSAIAYTPDSYPYFFIDTNANGTVDTDEATSQNGYASWTGRLLKAAYNYQMSIKDPGMFAHGGKYIIELLYDSTDDLNSVIAQPVDLSTAHRIDAGHFAGSDAPFRHWDTEGEVPGTCARCHTATGLPTYLKNGVNIAASPSNGLNCATCHNDLTTFTRYTSDLVTFPSGAKLTFGEGDDANLCINCHQGRESTKSVNAAITAAAVKDDEVSDKLSFRNPHYFAAGATLFGTDAQGAYQYDGKTYVGRFLHVEGFNTCVACHDAHALEVKVEACATCHPTVKSKEDLATIRMNTTGDIDGDGNADEGLKGEVETMQEKLLAAIQVYATEKAGAGIVYNPDSYPYFFIDTNADGVADPDELTSDNSYKNWTPRLLRAAYNYQWVQKDPGAFAHNGKYILEILYDSIADVGGSAATAGMTRP